MKMIIHDLGEEFNSSLSSEGSSVFYADGKYAPCKGCFHCWTKHPATCDYKDRLHEIATFIGLADELIIISENCYGSYSPKIKAVLDRGIGTSTPLSTYMGGLMHHTLRYGKKDIMKVYVYGDISEKERETWKLLAQCNATNGGWKNYKLNFISSFKELEEKVL